MTAPALVDPIAALTDDNLLAPMLPGIHSGSWDTWLTIVRGLYGLEMNAEQAAEWIELTKRTPPDTASRAAFFLVGRRGGKTQMAAALTLYETALRDWSGIASKGELIVGALVAADRRQAGQALRYIRGGIEASPMLRALVVKDTSEGIELSNGSELAVMTASHRSIRGRSFACVVADELCHWQQDGASPDAEILRAAEPALALTDGLLLGISTPYARRGVMFDRWKRYYGRDKAPSLVMQAPSRRLNANLPQSVVDAALEEDEPAGRAEYLAEWRRDVETFVSPEVVDACTVSGRFELPPLSGVKYYAYVDPAGGSGQDAMTLCIAHREEGRAIVDAIRVAKPPFNPEAVSREFAELVKRYRCPTVSGDRYAGEYARAPFKANGVGYELSDRPASDQFRDTLPLLNAGRVELLDHKQSLSELLNLERRTSRAGKDSISHPANGHDDAINSVCGAILLAIGSRRRPLKDWL